MKKIALTGSTGFVGSNLINYLKNDQCIQLVKLSRNEENGYVTSFMNELKINSFDAVVHLAGKAHDLKKTSDEQSYFTANTDLTIELYNQFLKSTISTFIYFSSVKAVADSVDDILEESHEPNPKTVYGISKLRAEQYIFSNQPSLGKRVFVLRPCMIHGPGNKGNLNLLYKIVSKGIPWPLGAFENKRSFCSIENVCFIIKELIERQDIPQGIYNIADDEPLSTNELISLIAQTQNKSIKISKLPKSLIKIFAKIGDIFGLSLNSERLHKLTETYVVRNNKIKSILGKPLPVTSKLGLIKTFQSIN
jgi:nucleoside-diphosphate-sugar epimerase